MKANLSPAIIVASLFGLLTACDGPAEQDGREQSAFEGSCVGYCGGEAPTGCFCDAECAANGDCCPDAARECSVVANEEECGDSEHDDGDDDAGDDGDAPSPNDLCFLGPDRDNSVCFPLAFPGSPSGYNYPSPLNNNYRKPVAYIDLDQVDESTKIAPNFTLGEIATRAKGRYAIVQPHAVERLQAMRDSAGSLRINSGYRSPSYNAGVGGASKSRHMYGDAFDIKPLSTSINSLEGKCTSNGGKLVEYNSHVHCDWRHDAQDTKLFGIAALAPDARPDDFAVEEYTATIERHEGILSAPAEGFDEGEPVRRWTAYDADGTVIAEYQGEYFTAPASAETVEVDVGRVVEAVITL
ncbi:MAG: D-Ala-D-Ala carboxypeptidase family metallohydrolase [Myxococcota bacterium]